jgi:hypothetical protein
MCGEAPRLHPESWRTLRQLIKLHGYDDLLKALRLQQVIDILNPPEEMDPQDARSPDR